MLDGAQPGDHRELARRVWAAVGQGGADPAVAVYVEALGLAAARTPPYPEAARAVAEAWTAWFAGRLPGPDEERWSQARAALALVDGLLLVRLTAGPDAAADAARALGVG